MLYVVDSVTRGWVEQAKKAGQALGQASPPPGTYAAGVGRVTELLPSFMNDMINNAPEEQKVRYLETLYESKKWSVSRWLTDELLCDFSYITRGRSENNFCLISTTVTYAHVFSEIPGSHNQAR